VADSTARPPSGSPQSRPGRVRRVVDPREWRVRVKLVAVLAVPTVAFLALAGINVTTLVLDARAYEGDARTAKLGRDVAALTHELQRERDLTAGYVVARDEAATRRLAAQRRAVDDAVARYRDRASAVREEASGPLAHTLAQVARDLAALDRLRDAVDERTVTRGAAVDEYSSDVAHLVDVVGGVTGSGDAELTQRLRALAAFAESKDRSSETRGVVFALAQQDRFGTGEYEQLTTALANERAASERFLETADDRQRALVSRTVRGQALLTVSRLEEEALSGGGRSLDVDAQQWLAASTTRQQQMAQAERLLLDRVVARSEALSGSARQQAVVTGSTIVAVLLVSLLLSLGVARSMARQLTRLRRGALDVAQVQLPEAVSRIREAPPGADPEREVPSLNLHSRDEVGQVAAAFDAVHRQAVRLAGDQALLRRDVNTLFVNFSRRSQSLVERQLSLIDDLEAREQDPTVLENLFRLDHLATRMRRNNESLLVIAGSDTTRRWSRPVPLPDVVLAAVSEIEQFTRVEQRTDADVAVAGHAVSDVVHLLAELLENATRSSPPSSSVVVSGRAVRGGSEALLEVEDSGIGMTKGVLRDANRRLGDPGGTVPTGPRMGLFVVSRLARRYGILVDLDESAHGGVVARVRLPAGLVTTSAAPDGDPAAAQGGGRVAPTTRTDGAVTAGGDPGHESDPAAENDPAAESDRAHDGHARNGVEVTTTHSGATVATQAGGSAARTVSDDADGASADWRGATTGTAPARRVAHGGRHDEVSTVVLPVFDSVSEWFRDRPDDEPADTSRPYADEGHAPGGAPHPDTAPPDAPPPDAPPLPDTPHLVAAETASARAVGAAGPSVDDGSPVAVSPGPGAGSPGGSYETGPGGLPRRPVPHASRDEAHGPGGNGSAPASWTSTGDAGWAAAEDAASPTSAGTTPAGLPIRRPMAHYVPGASDSPRANQDTDGSGVPTRDDTPSGATPPTATPPGETPPGRPDAGAPAPGWDQPAGPPSWPAAHAPAGPDTSPDLLRSAAAPGLGRPQGPATSPDQVRGLLSRYYRGVREAREASDTTTTEAPAPPSPTGASPYDSDAHEGEST
jgi:CHASE3 domain sensor protein